MGDPADSPASAAEPSMMRRVRQSPGTSEATLLLFVIVAALWLEAAATAQVWYHSAPPSYRFPSRSAFYAWMALGVVGVLLVFGSLVHRVWPVRQRRLLVVIAACVGRSSRDCFGPPRHGSRDGDGSPGLQQLGRGGHRNSGAGCQSAHARWCSHARPGRTACGGSWA